MKKNINVLQIGLGPIGLRISHILFDRKKMDIVAAIDVDPQKVGEDIGLLVRRNKKGVIICDDLETALKQNHIDIAVITTSSKADIVAQQMKPLLLAGIPVVTTCEELSYPWQTSPQVAQHIDTLAKNNNVAVLSTGVNPGFLMDYLPTVSTAICERVHQIKVERVQDASKRRLPFQNKIGAGLSKPEFQAKVAGKILRHVGLLESVFFIADRMGWVLDKVDETLEPLLDENEIATGVKQVAIGYIDHQIKIELEFIASTAIQQSKDAISVKGNPSFELQFDQPINGDVATTAITVNAIPTVIHAKPGLRTMADIEAISFWE